MFIFRTGSRWSLHDDGLKCFSIYFKRALSELIKRDISNARNAFLEEKHLGSKKPNYTIKDEKDALAGRDILVIRYVRGQIYVLNTIEPIKKYPF